MKTVRLTLELSEDFIKLLKANLELSEAKNKVENNLAEPCTMLGLMVCAEARGGLPEHINSLLPPERRHEIKFIHENREVYQDGKLVK